MAIITLLCTPCYLQTPPPYHPLREIAIEVPQATIDMSDFIGDIVADSAATTPDVVDETSPPENDAGGNKKGNGKSKGNNKQQKDQVPIEELYDLSKPIKRVSLIVFFYCNRF